MFSILIILEVSFCFGKVSNLMLDIVHIQIFYGRKVIIT